jgi:hypothetical protein
MPFKEASAQCIAVDFDHVLGLISSLSFLSLIFSGAIFKSF